jgi:hypothetical protein
MDLFEPKINRMIWIVCSYVGGWILLQAYCVSKAALAETGELSHALRKWIGTIH